VRVKTGGESPPKFTQNPRGKCVKISPDVRCANSPHVLFVKEKIATNYFCFFSCVLSKDSLDCLPMNDHLFPSNPEEYEEYVATLASDPEMLPDPPEEIWLDDSHLDERMDDCFHAPMEDQYLDSMYEDRYDVSEYGMDGCCGDF